MAAMLHLLPIHQRQDGIEIPPIDWPIPYSTPDRLLVPLPRLRIPEAAVEHPVAGAAQADELLGLVKVLMVSVNDPLVLPALLALIGPLQPASTSAFSPWWTS